MNTTIKKCKDHVLMNTPVLHLEIGLVLHPPGFRLLICLFTINFFTATRLSHLAAVVAGA